MRDYARVAPTFWTKGSGKRLRGKPDAQLLGLYLLTCSSANMIGLYYLPLVTLCHETGLTPKEAREAFSETAKADFAHYDEAAEMVWVPNGASFQMGEGTEIGDKRRKGLVRELKPYLGHPFATQFSAKYGPLYRLDLPISAQVPVTREARIPLPVLDTGLDTPSNTQDTPPNKAHAQAQAKAHAQEPATPDGCAEVFDHFLAAEKRHRPTARRKELPDQDRKLLRAKLKSGMTAEDLKLACEGLFLSPHHTGRNDQGTEYLAFHYVVKGNNAETFIALARQRARETARDIPAADLPPEKLVSPQRLLELTEQFSKIGQAS